MRYGNGHGLDRNWRGCSVGAGGACRVAITAAICLQGCMNRKRKEILVIVSVLPRREETIPFGQVTFDACSWRYRPRIAAVDMPLSVTVERTLTDKGETSITQPDTLMDIAER